MSLTSDAEGRLISQMDRLTEEMRKMATSLGEMTANLKHVVETQDDAKSYGDRLTVLETEAKMTKEWVENARTNQRWLVGLLVGSFLSSISLAITIIALVLRHH